MPQVMKRDWNFCALRCVNKCLGQSILRESIEAVWITEDISVVSPNDISAHRLYHFERSIGQRYIARNVRFGFRQINMRIVDVFPPQPADFTGAHSRFKCKTD